MSKQPDLKYLVENELFITCPFLPTNLFVSYCKDRGIQTSREQLEKFEELGIFHPVARVQYPRIEIKVEYLDSGDRYRILGVLEDGEEWSGDTKEREAYFQFEKKYAESWLEEDLLWAPSSRPFQKWETFEDENGHRRVESFYSIFQCHTLYNLIRSTEMQLRAEWWASYTEEGIDNASNAISHWARGAISRCQENGIRGEAAAAVCQILSNRYFPKTQSDRRSMQLSIPSEYHNWDWDEYCRNWDAEAVLTSINMSLDEIKRLQELVAVDAKYVDPLERWYGLVSFVSVEKKKQLKGRALLAQTLYSMEQMLRLFYEELTGDKLYPPDESPHWEKDRFYGEGVTQNELQYLEFLTNQYHLNPRPKLILVVEGDGEKEQFPRLAKELFGTSFPRLGIEIVNLKGIAGFTGRKRTEKYGALERFIDDYHRRQTIVFVVLDGEDGVSRVKNRLLPVRSRYGPKRRVTKEEYIHIWDKNIEFDNFSHDEIARAMTKLSGDRYTFQSDEIADCENCFDAGRGNPLGNLFEQEVGYELSKTKLLETLFGFIISSPESEFDDDGKARRPVVQVIQKVRELAARNYQPVTYDIWLRNQESGYFGDLIE